MPREPRQIDPEGVYHIIARGNNKSTIFRSSADYAAYLWLLERAKQRFHFSLFHYVLMPNHIHLLLKPNSSELAKAMQVVQMGYARRFCKTYQFVGHVWQSRYANLQIETDAYLMACGNYIEMNPVRAALVTRPEAWFWSSYGHYAIGRRSSLIDENPLFASLAKDTAERQRIYQELLSKTRAT